MPDTLAAYMGQRYRWGYGAMQIFKQHAKAVLFGGTQLTSAQRYQFLAGWLPWISDGLALIVTAFALIWTGLMTLAPTHFDVPMEALSTAALGLFSIKTAKTFLLYPSRSRIRHAGCVACLRRRIGFDAYGWQGCAGGAVHFRTSLSADAQMRGRRAARTDHARGVAGDTAVRALCGGTDRHRHIAPRRRPGHHAVDGQAGGAGAALWRHHHCPQASAQWPMRQRSNATPDITLCAANRTKSGGV